MKKAAQAKPDTTLLFTLPFASEASAKHVNKLVEILRRCGRPLMVVGDERLRRISHGPPVVRFRFVPTLHYLSTYRNRALSAVLWAARLLWVLLVGVYVVLRERSTIGVVICYKGSYYTPVLLTARFLGIPTVNYLPNNDADALEMHYQGQTGASGLAGTVRRLQHFNQKIADVNVVQSLHLVERLGLGNQKHKVRLGRLHVDTDLYRPIVPYADRPQAVGFVGRLNSEKGVVAFAKAAAHLADSGFEFLIIGDGPQRAGVEQFVVESGLTCVHVLGWKSESELVGLLNSMRLIVMPTHNEGVPNVLIEAMSCGVVGLASPIDGIPDLIVSGLTGFSLPSREPRDIAEAVSGAMSSPDLSKVSEAGRAHVVEHFSLGAATEQWRSILRLDPTS